MLLKMWSDNETDDEQDQRPLYVSNAHDPRLGELSIKVTTAMQTALDRLGASRHGYELPVQVYAANMYTVHGDLWPAASPITAEHRPMLAGIKHAELKIKLCYMAIVQASSDAL